jgi:hypothetical protein
MFFQKLFKNRTHAGSKVYVNMKSIETDVQENDHSVIIINDQADITHSQIEQVCVHII